MTILDEIIAYKKKEVENLKLIKSLKDLENTQFFKRNCFSFKEVLIKKGSSQIIAEYKRKSPSKGMINETAKVEDVTTGYVKAGAAALSVLTDEKYFGGGNEYLITARLSNQCPILRKDFIVDEFQVVEAKGIGADVILLIASVLSKKDMNKLARLAKSFGMEVLMEVHDKEELEKVNDYIDVVGVNNRNLKDFKVSIQQSINLSEFIPDKYAKISESGINDIESIKLLKSYGFSGFLIGESFMKTPIPGLACKELIQKLNS